ncbi:hypothetical protein GOV12_01430 [Candidatus Pacearchaeota archaeon]|nr:hypothetical protein [Candidatus Pacearchaeota archaeon]
MQTLEQTLEIISSLKTDLSATITETFCPPLKNPSDGCMSLDSNEVPDIETQQSARQQLKMHYNDSNWMSMRYYAGLSLNADDLGKQTEEWFEKLKDKLNASKEIKTTTSFPVVEEIYSSKGYRDVEIEEEHISVVPDEETRRETQIDLAMFYQIAKSTGDESTKARVLELFPDAHIQIKQPKIQRKGCLLAVIAGTSTLAAGASYGIYELVDYLC